MRLTVRAPGKVNLCLLLGPLRADGRHELVSLVEPTSLADELVVSEAGPWSGEDEVVCPGVPGDNLAAAALRAWRSRSGWEGPALRVEIAKRVPVAAGMGGGSSDAAAALRAAAHASGRPADPVLAAIAPGIGADVPALLEPGPALIEGAGERVTPLGPLPDHGLLLLPPASALPTAAVFAEADRLGLPRDVTDLGARAAVLADALASGGPLRPDLLVNDLEPAACSLEPSIRAALEEARAAGADRALVSGSGPTVLGVFAGADGAAREAAAAESPGDRSPAPVAARPVDASWAAVRADAGA